jgi:GGDEF domain-containing protein
MAGLVAAIGLLFIQLASHVIGKMVVRRQDKRHAANHDALTSLLNRCNVMAQVDRLFALAGSTQQWILVAFIDPDEFKAINNTYGMDQDMAIEAMCSRLAPLLIGSL